MACVGARRHAEEAGLRVDGAQRCRPAARLDPRDVVAHGRRPSSLARARGRARASPGWSCRRRWGRPPRRRSCRPSGDSRPEDQHVFGQPAFVAAQRRRDAQRQALLAQQRVAAVARAVRPDLAWCREKWAMSLAPDVRLARPRHVGLAGRSAARPPSARTG
jgi:hypothetical protein